MKTEKLVLTILLIFLIIPLFMIKTVFAESISYQANITHSATAPEIDFPIYSEGAVLIESSTGKILYGKDENKKLYPASTTKILTAIIAIEKYNLTEKITASNSAIMAIPSGYSNAAIQPGESLPLQDLLDLFLIHSANEIGYILAENISGNIDEFAKLMNQKASEIGCKNTHFTNPSGIHNTEHYSTAYDMALIAKYCMKNESFRNIVSKTSCTINATDKYQERYFKNTNDLLDKKSKYYYEYAIGIKTGFTSQAKNCLIAASKKDNMELITVALGAEATDDGRSGRYVDTINLFNFGFNNYKFQQLANANTIIKEISIENATKDTKNLSLILEDNITALAPANADLSKINYSLDIPENISAPISKGDVLGKITYTINGIDYSSNLIASNNVEEFNFSLSTTQIISALIVLFILIKLLFFKKKKSKKKTKKYNKYDSIYKFK